MGVAPAVCRGSPSAAYNDCPTRTFSVGGQTIQRSGEYDNCKFVGWAEQEETGQSYRADHAFVDFRFLPTARNYR